MPPSQRRQYAPKSVNLTVDGQAVELSLRRSSRARRYTLRLVATGEFILTVPAGGSVEKAVGFAEANIGWIRARLARLPRSVPFEEGAFVPLRGVSHEIRHADTRRGSIQVITAQGEGFPVIKVPGGREFVARRLTDWLRREARRDLEEAVRRHTAALGVRARRVTVRDQVSRWGSCSASGGLSFSWRLVLAPPFVLDYLAAHEVAHLVEMNHGPRFWRLVHELCPKTDAAEAWLRRHGPALHSYGR